jgi:type I restriction enzyme, S subunit
VEVRPGYKQTEVGVIPEEWEVCRVYELVKHGPKNGYSGRSGKDTQGTPTLSLSATSTGRLVLDSKTVKYLEERISPDSDLFLKPGDILVQRSNTTDLVGTTAIFTRPAATYICPDLMMRLRFKELPPLIGFGVMPMAQEGDAFS